MTEIDGTESGERLPEPVRLSQKSRTRKRPSAGAAANPKQTPSTAASAQRAQSWAQGFERSGGDFDAACAAAGISPSRFYSLAEADAVFAQACATALRGLEYAVLARATRVDEISTRLGADLAAFGEQRLRELIDAGADADTIGNLRDAESPAHGRTDRTGRATVADRCLKWLSVLSDAQQICHRATKHRQGIELTAIESPDETAEATTPIHASIQRIERLLGRGASTTRSGRP